MFCTIIYMDGASHMTVMDQIKDSNDAQCCLYAELDVMATVCQECVSVTVSLHTSLTYW